MEHGKSLWSRKPALLATLLLTAISLSACVVARDRGDRGDWNGRHHHWNNDRNWNHDQDWQGDGDNWWKRRH